MIFPPSDFSITRELYHRKSFIFDIAFYCSPPGTVIRAGLHTQRTSPVRYCTRCILYSLSWLLWPYYRVKPVLIASQHRCSTCTHCITTPMLYLYSLHQNTDALPVLIASQHRCSTCTHCITTPVLYLYSLHHNTDALPVLIAPQHQCSTHIIITSPAPTASVTAQS